VFDLRLVLSSTEEVELGERLLLERILRYWRGSRVYAVCVTAAFVRTVYVGACSVGFSGLYGCLSSGVRPDGSKSREICTHFVVGFVG
jgi:hypothetical protein